MNQHPLKIAAGVLAIVALLVNLQPLATGDKPVEKVAAWHQLDERMVHVPTTMQDSRVPITAGSAADLHPPPPTRTDFPKITVNGTDDQGRGCILTGFQAPRPPLESGVNQIAAGGYTVEISHAKNLTGDAQRHSAVSGTITEAPFLFAAPRVLNWTGGSAGTNANMANAGNWAENESPMDPPLANLIIATRNGATGDIPTLLVGGDYALRSLSLDNAAGRFSPEGGLRIGPTTLSSSTVTRTLSFTNPQEDMISASNGTKVEFTKFANAASLLLNLDFSGRSPVFTDATSEIIQSTATFTGSGGIRKTGPGTLRLESANTHTGGLTVEGGLVVVNSPAALGANPAAPQADSVVLNGGTLRFENSNSSPSSNRGIQVGQNIGTLDISGSAITLLGSVSDLPGEAGILAKKGGFILRLNTSNTHRGGTHLMEGRIRYSSAAAFGTGPLTLDHNTGFLPTSSGFAVPNDLIMTGGTVRFGGEGHAHIHEGDIDLTGGTRTIRLSDPVTVNGSVSNGTLGVLADSPAFALTLNGGVGPLTVAPGAMLVIGATATVAGDIHCSGSLSYAPAVTAGSNIILDNGALTTPGGTLLLGPGAAISGSGVIVANIQLAAESSITGTAGQTLLVIGEITGAGQASNIVHVIDPFTAVDGVQTSHFGVATFSTDFKLPGGFPTTSAPVFRFDLGDPAASDRVHFQDALLQFGTGGLDLSQMELIPHAGFGEGVYQIITATVPISGVLGTHTRAKVGGLPVWLRIGNDGKSIELRVGAAATEFPFTAGETYFGRNNYIEYRAGNVPVLLVTGHDGGLEPQEIPLRTYGATARDLNLNPLTIAMADEFTARTGKRPHVIISHLRRNRLDPNREIVEAAQGNIHAEQAWHEYHNSFLRTARDAMEREYGFALTFDMHGHGHEIARLELGYLLGATELNVNDSTFKQPGYTWQSSLRSMMLNNPSLPFPALIRGSKSLGERFVEIGIPAWPSATYPTIGTAPFFNGGYTTSEHSCLDCNSPMDAIQIETHFGVRNDESARAKFARDFADVLQAYLVDYYQYSPGTGTLLGLTASHAETSRGGPVVTLSVKREGYLAAAETLSLTFAGDAVKGTDFTVSAESVSFAAGERTKNITLSPAAAGPAQGDRSILVVMAPQYRQSTDGSRLEITLGDGVSQTVRITAATQTVRKDSGTATFHLRRTLAGPSLQVPLLWSGSAVPGGHYQPVETAVFPAGELTSEIHVPLRDDGYIEDDLTLAVAIAAAPGYTRGSPSQALVSLIDNDRPGGLTAWLTGGLEGNIWQDRSGFGHHATTLPGGLGPVATAGAVAFDGVSATAALPRFPVEPDGSFSIAFFFRAEIGSLNTERNLFSYGARGQQGALGVYLATPTQLRTSLGTAAPVTIVGTWNDGTWHHYALTVTAGGSARIYINGQLATSSNAWNGPLLANRLFWIGWNPGVATTAGFFKGSIRDFRIYQKAVSQAVLGALAGGEINFPAWLASFGIAESAGTSLFQHYAFGRKPWEPAPSTPLFKFTGSRFELEFIRQLGASDLRYELQRSADLTEGAWETLATLPPSQQDWVIHQSEISLEDLHGLISIVDESPPNELQARLFYRIKASLK